MTKMTKRIGAAMLSTALLLGALTGCGSSSSSASTDGDNAASASTENPHITVVLKTLASEYWAYVAKGCEQAGKDLAHNLRGLTFTGDQRKELCAQDNDRQIAKNGIHELSSLLTAW